MSHTALDGKVVIRVAVGNIRTRQQDIEELWRSILDILNEIEAAEPAHLEFKCELEEDAARRDQRSDESNEMYRQAG